MEQIPETSRLESKAPRPSSSTSVGVTSQPSDAVTTTTPTLEISAPSTWLPILESSTQLVLYNPTSHALTVTNPSLLNTSHPVHSNRRWIGRLLDSGEHTHSQERLRLGDTTEGRQDGILAPMPLRAALATRTLHSPPIAGKLRTCPWCSRPFTSLYTDPRQEGFTRVPNYFQLLEQTNYERDIPEITSPDNSISYQGGEHEERSRSTASFTSEHAIRLDLTHEGQDEEQSPLSPLSGPGQSKGSSSGRGYGSLSGTPKAASGGYDPFNPRSAEVSGQDDSMPGTPKRRFGDSSMAQGYFAAFFKEEKRLGMGANGSVYLCQHILDGNYLGHFAVKKIAVGHSHSYLLKILREVRLLETLRHPNIITYHHSWLETTRFSSFGPAIPTLHVLMEWAEHGSLEDLIEARQGKSHHHVFDPVAQAAGEQSDDEESTRKSARIRAFKAKKKSQAAEQEQTPHGLDISPGGDGSGNGKGRGRSKSTGVSPGIMLLSPDEIKSYLSDIVSGLAFLHDRSILHLDLKLGNVLLTKDDERLIPRAMLSDFGTSRDALQTPKVRSGNTGTVEYSAPEALARDASGSLLQVDSKSDMWSLGMILYKLIFFRLPYPEIDPTDVDGIEREVLRYEGFKASADVMEACRRRGLPRGTLLLLEGLLRVDPSQRPTSERVMAALKEGTLEPPSKHKRNDLTALTLIRRRSSSTSVGDHSHSTSSLEKAGSRRLSDPPAPAPIAPFAKARSRSSSPLLNRLSPNRTNFSESITTLLLPPPVRSITRTRWRTVRTCLLLVKILSLSNVCHPAYPILLIQTLALALAVCDVWQEGEDGMPDLKLSAGLAIIHVFLLGLIRWKRESLCIIRV